MRRQLLAQVGNERVLGVGLVHSYVFHLECLFMRTGLGQGERLLNGVKCLKLANLVFFRCMRLC